MVAVPPSRKRRRPTRSSSTATTRTATRPETPLVPITSPIVRSEPPSSRTWSGRRKNEAKVRKKQKFAAVTRRKRGVSSRSSAAGAPASAWGARIDDAARLAATGAALYMPRMGTERRRELRRRRKRRRERLKQRRREQARERRKQRAKAG